jgi:hypothetical protein
LINIWAAIMKPAPAVVAIWEFANAYFAFQRSVAGSLW